MLTDLRGVTEAGRMAEEAGWGVRAEWGQEKGPHHALSVSLAK